jgi:hypothetical protein
MWKRLAPAIEGNSKQTMATEHVIGDMQAAIGRMTTDLAATLELVERIGVERRPRGFRLRRAEGEEAPTDERPSWDPRDLDRRLDNALTTLDARLVALATQVGQMVAPAPSARSGGARPAAAARPTTAHPDVGAALEQALSMSPPRDDRSAGLLGSRPAAAPRIAAERATPPPPPPSGSTRSATAATDPTSAPAEVAAATKRTAARATVKKAAVKKAAVKKAAVKKAAVKKAAVKETVAKRGTPRKQR